MKKKRGVNIYFTNRWLYTFIVIGILIAIGVGVYAATYTASGAGHPYTEISTCGANEVLKMNSAGTAWTCASDTASTLKTMVIEIGDWNMVATEQITINSPFSDASKIRAIDVMIRTDGYEGSMYEGVKPLTSVNAGDTGLSGGVVLVYSQYTGQTPKIVLKRSTAGFRFTSYDDTSYNRGWVVIQYVD